MKRKYQLALPLAAFAASGIPAWANGTPVGAEADTLRNFDMEEAVVVASPKETSLLKKQPLSVSTFSKEDLERLGVKSVKDLSNFAPNFHLPNYGSRLTSAAYIRGMGARVNTPAMGLYVDNVAYTDKSAYDFSFLDIERVDMLRGPQGTLYGRNTMGGLIRVFTADPLKKKGTTLSLGGATHGGAYHAKAMTYLHPSDRVALSVGGFYEGKTGYFDNTTTGKAADGLSAGGGKVRLAWRPNADLRFDWTVAYEYSDEDACPYYLQSADVSSFPALADKVGEISQNRQSNYRRGMLNANWSTEWHTPNWVLSSVAGYQNLDDRLLMDQDFSKADIFSLTQSQRINAFTEELSLRSHRGRRWAWTTGVFFMYQHTDTDCPVTFYGDGVQYLNGNFKKMFAGLHQQFPMMPPMGLEIKNSTLPFGADLSTPNLNTALFHQSTFNRLGVDGLSLTLGLRLDYDRQQLDLKSGLQEGLQSSFWVGDPKRQRPLQPVWAQLNGETDRDSWQLLPKVALQYEHKNGRGNVYAAVSKGYRSGGYNIQAYSDLSRQLLQREIMLQAMPPRPSKAPNMGAVVPAAPAVTDLAYKPEVSWNYELGGHLYFMEGAMKVDYTLFYTQTKDQQLARFAEGGMGRVTVNAGKSRSCGAELAVRGWWLDRRLQVSANYGYTYAELKEHHLGKVDYSGNRVPFAPEHTLGAVAQFRQPLAHRVFKSVYAGADVQGAGRIYWDEANRYSQPFYAVMGANVGCELLGNVQLEFRGENLTGTRYDAFAFESLGNRYGQWGTPRNFSANLKISF